MPVAVLFAALVLSGHAPASPSPHVWLHYDYLVYPDGHSDAPDPAAIQQVVGVYAAHGIQLEIDNQHTAVPTSNPVIGISILGNRCPGALDVADVRAQYFRPTSNHEWHYALFGDKVANWNDSCNPTASGFAELNGDNFIISMDVARRWRSFASQVTAAFFMHELGHNLGLRHGGNDDWNNKPNYLSVMNYSFPIGIPYASTPGGTTFAGYRLDYSESVLPTLDLANLNETLGIQGGATDITHFLWGYQPGDPASFIGSSGPASGPIDWNLDGNATETDVAVNLVAQTGPYNCPCFLPEYVTGFDDWTEVRGYILGTIAHGPKTIPHEDAAGQPVVTGLSTSNGPPYGGTTVTITGTHLGKATQVLFGIEPAASFRIVDQQTIVAASPSTPSVSGGAVDVHVISADNPSPSVAADMFTYAPWQMPVVQSISPTAGPQAGGTTLTIQVGSYELTNGVTGVFFGTTPAASFTQPIINFPNITITAVAPPGTGTIDITITNPGGTSPTGASDRYTYLPPPAITSLSPTSGLPGTLVTIHGSGLTGATQVCFGQTCSSAASPPIVLDDNTLTVNLPASPFEGSTVDVTVTTPGGTTPTGPADLFTLL